MIEYLTCKNLLTKVHSWLLVSKQFFLLKLKYRGGSRIPHGRGANAPGGGAKFSKKNATEIEWNKKELQ